MKQSLPFLVKKEHEGSAAGWGIDGSKGHDIEGVQDAVGSDKAEFVAVGVANSNLVEAGFGVDADPVQGASAGGKIVGGFITTWDGKVADEGNGVEAVTRDAKAPDKVIDVVDMLLVRFGGKHCLGQPASEVGKQADPANLKELV